MTFSDFSSFQLANFEFRFITIIISTRLSISSRDSQPATGIIPSPPSPKAMEDNTLFPSRRCSCYPLSASLTTETKSVDHALPKLVPVLDRGPPFVTSLSLRSLEGSPSKPARA